MKEMGIVRRRLALVVVGVAIAIGVVWPLASSATDYGTTADTSPAIAAKDAVGHAGYKAVGSTSDTAGNRSRIGMASAMKDLSPEAAAALEDPANRDKWIGLVRGADGKLYVDVISAVKPDEARDARGAGQ